MIIDAKETRELAEMLRIRLTDKEASRFSADMSAILEYAKLLSELDVTEVDPMGVGADGYAELRDDVPTESLPLEDLEVMSGGSFDPVRQAFVTKAIFS